MELFFVGLLVVILVFALLFYLYSFKYKQLKNGSTYFSFTVCVIEDKITSVLRNAVIYEHQPMFGRINYIFRIDDKEIAFYDQAFLKFNASIPIKSIKEIIIRQYSKWMLFEVIYKNDKIEKSIVIKEVDGKNEKLKAVLTSLGCKITKKELSKTDALLSKFLTFHNKF